MHKLTGRQVVSELQIQAEELEYQVPDTSPMYGKKYHRAIFQNKVFTVTPEVFKQWRDGELAEFNVIDTKRKVVDSQTNETSEVDALAYSGSATWKQLKNIRTNEVELDVIEKKAMKELKLDETTINELLKA
jgi:hypothetical protein